MKVALAVTLRLQALAKALRPAVVSEILTLRGRPFRDSALLRASTVGSTLRPPAAGRQVIVRVPLMGGRKMNV